MLIQGECLGLYRRFGYFIVFAAENGLEAAFQEPLQMASLKDGADALGRPIYRFILI